MDDQRKPTDGSPTDTGKDDTPLGPSNAIGRRLRAYYEDVAAEPVPDRFLSLLDALDAAEKKSKTSGTGE
ncbi:NepR family anti-sigma factor [Aureimonas frigidaquae]|uniref:NepR family anti-sigma factor n=1 Tax=Aureimonas frigidaquae TaxID=424757 RepID=UPI000781153B|nr:NepR family anti-sigma factor [Aureimonas frigidaquae]